MKSTQTDLNNSIVHQLPLATVLVDLSFNLIDASHTWHQFFPSKKDLNNPQKIFTFFDGHEGCTPELLEEYLIGNDIRTIRHSVMGKDNLQWLESTFAPWFDDNKTIQGTIIQTIDIGRQIQKDVELEQTKELFQATTEINHIGSWEYNIETEKLSWCKMTKQIHEVPENYEPNVAEAIEFYKQGYSRNKISMLFHKILQEGTSFNERLQIITQKGEEKWVAAGGKAIKKEGKTLKIFGTFQDINQQVVAEKRTKESERLLTTLIDNLPINVFIKDKDSRKILVNKAECSYLEASPDELIGKTDFDLYDNTVAKTSRDEDLEVMRSLKPMLGEETINVRKDGSITHFLTSKIPLLDLEGKAYGLIGMSMDITNLKQKEEQLRNLINVTAIQNKKLINFAHIVSHNLRSHSANFSMLLDFLIKEKEPKEKERILGMLSSASDNLLDTLENLNEVVDISTNVNLDKKSLSLNEGIKRVQQNLSAFLEKNKVEVTNTIDESIRVMSVPAYLESIILNLMTNAVKYRHPMRVPQITLTASNEPKGIALSVTDNGLGIDLERYGDKIFGMYKTFHNNKDARGLGLYIIKNQIEAMDGYISVESSVNKGSVFKVFFNEENE
ncbi:PAS domain-containing sensor histidine kinase [Flagellimonas meridianipacifica]|uniref:histidine kinase n=1 Tax=Flagellimonas meridianipacifica TaxID=1080225 RepID=A0A2T0M6V3_9FLAO|nr:PAS domain-containing sensor histidine kinase [Allomuricauda pacifica]PRX53105.1 PAS domain S-box-containing protein [Allomuricauda pacifica]